VQEPGGDAWKRAGSSPDSVTHPDRPLPDAPPSTDRVTSAQRVLEIALALAVAIACMEAFARASRTAFNQIDFECFYDAAVRLRNGQRLYIPVMEARPYVYLPTLALALVPLSWLPLRAASLVWLGLNIALLLLCLWMFARMHGLTRRSAVGVACAAILAFQYRPTEITLGLGQANIPIMALMLAMAWAYQRNRIGLFSALVVAGFLLKTWMVAWVGFLLLKRRWLAATLTALACALLAAIEFWIVGWREVGPYLVITSTFFSDMSDRWMVSQSIPAFARTHFRGTPIVDPLVRSVVMERLTVAVGAVGALVAAWNFWRVRGPSSPRRASLEIGLFFLSLFLMLPYCDPEYFVLCLPLFWTLLVARDPRDCRAAVAALALYLLMLPHYPVGGPSLAGHNQGLPSLMTTAMCTVMCGLWLLALREVRREGA